MIANFVETLDGVVSYNTSGLTGGGFISGDNPQDKMVMGLLRASADASHLWLQFIAIGCQPSTYPIIHLSGPGLQYDALRTLLGKKEKFPISVVMSTDGHIDFDDKTFSVPDLRIVIATTKQGYAHLAQQVLPKGTEARSH